MSTSTSRSYSIVEPHPSVANNMHYISTGRGGFGNAVRSSSSNTSAWGSGSERTASRLGSMSASSTTSSASSSRKTFTTGRGGAGNVFPSSERAIFSFDEELEQQLRWERDAAPVYHVGRGGAGNIGHVSTSGTSRTSPPPPLAGVGGTGAVMMQRRPSEDSSLSANSASSRGSESGADQFNRSVKKGWKKITGLGMHHHHHHNLQQ
ncbi:hypothetical protein AYL99_01571 [Fonsecaea erecta]|uniref:Uncharacterized protein n=1 Tax=Fonsecaea erecta TaxID=1367422 RepID=A0A179A0P3_9EURO|nr:hypothetical protein AYL99_01571 [Fonsecaea erecta]OAP65599.1 hypothetical protein AYL99_01571 [Fonsecaea erecta]